MLQRAAAREIHDYGRSGNAQSDQQVFPQPTAARKTRSARERQDGPRDGLHICTLTHGCDAVKDGAKSRVEALSARSVSLHARLRDSRRLTLLPKLVGCRSATTPQLRSSKCPPSTNWWRIRRPGA